MSVEDFRAAHTAEKERTDAITAKSGETLEQIYAREDKDGKLTDLETAGKPAKTFTQDEVEATVQKRVKNLATENERLKAELAAKPVAATGGPLDAVSDPTKLAEAEQTAQSGLEQADDLISQLRDDPEGVEQVLRKYLGESAGTVLGETPDANLMRTILRNAKEGFRNTLKAVPQRKAFLDARAKAEPIAKKVHPWLSDPEDERTAMVQRFVQQMPALKQNPAWDYWLGCAVTQHLALMASAKKSAPGGGPQVKLRLKSALPGTSRPGSAGKAGKMTLAQAKAKGDVGAMADAMDL